MIKWIQFARSEWRIQDGKPYLTAAYHSPLLLSKRNNEERFASE